MGFETVRLAQLPVWLDGPTGRAYEGAQGADQDAAIEAAKNAVKLRFPGGIEPTDDEALYHAGEHRRIERAPGEDGAAYIERLKRAPLYWYWAGTDAGYINIFEPFFTPYGSFAPATEELRRLDPVRDARMIEWQRIRGRVDPTLWLAETAPECPDVIILSNAEADGWDGNFDWNSRVFILLESTYNDPPLWLGDGLWDEAGVYDDGGLWDISMTVDELSYIRRMIRRTKSPGDYPTAIALRYLADWTTGTIPPDGFWGSPGFYDDGGDWEDMPDGVDVCYLVIGHTWDEHNWIGQAGDYPLTDLWPAEDDGLGGYVPYAEDPIQI